MDLKKFEKDMAAFSFSQHQDILTYLARLKIKGWLVEDAKRWVEQTKKDLVKDSQINYKIKQCPDCQAPMRFLSVNVNKATQTGDDSKSVWLCFNKDCMRTEYE